MSISGKETTVYSGATDFPAHGPITCRECWQSCDRTQKDQVTPDGKFRLVNDPGAWGSADPKILLLGISKGNTQANEFAAGEFDDVAFKDCRPRLLKVLTAVGLLEATDDIDSLMTAAEQDFAFGSVVRCSVTGLKDGKWKADTPIVLPAFKHAEASVWLTNCLQRFLVGLPDRLQLIVLAGNSEQWISTLSKSINSIYPADFKRINEVAYRAGGKLWVHIGHPSRLNGYFNEFVSGPGDYRQGNKRVLAAAAIRQNRVDV